MLANVHSEEFRDGIGKVLSVVDKKNSRPILTYTLITAKNNQLELSATDLEVSAKVIIDASVEKEGNFCVNAKNLSDILRELPNDVLKIEIPENENILKITCKDIHFSLLVYKNDDFPHLAFENKNSEFTLSSESMLDIINKTFHAISNDETRLFLNGIYLQEVESKLRVVATDGHRLSLVDTDIENSTLDNLVNGIIIPKKGVYELKKIAETFSDKNIKISVDDSFMYVNAEEKYFLSVRLIAREYPKYQAVIPSKTSFTLKADKNLLFDAVRRIKIMSNEKSNGVRVKLEGRDMVVMANHPSLGNARETIQVDYDGKDMEIGFNAKYLMDTLSTLNDGEVVFELNNELSPVVIKSQLMPNYLGIIMPLKL